MFLLLAFYLSNDQVMATNIHWFIINSIGDADTKYGVFQTLMSVVKKGLRYSLLESFLGLTFAVFFAVFLRCLFPIQLTGFRVRARICAQVKTSLLMSSRSRAILRISSLGAPFWKGECLGYNDKSNLCQEARVDIECRPFEVERSVWQIHLA